MNIKRIKIHNLYGYLDKDIIFNEDITILVGINGSGKTSILNILNWIISPSLANLCVTEFKFVKLWLTFKNKDYEILCTQNTKTLEYSVTSENKNYHPLIINLKTEAKLIPNNEALRNSLIEGYKLLTPDENEQETWQLIRSFPSPTIIGLDRNIYTEESSEKFFIDDSDKSLVRKKIGASKSPVERVKEIVNLEYRKRKNKVLNLTNSLKNQLMLSAFDGNITVDTLMSGVRYKVNLNQIEIAENRVDDYFQNFEKDSLNEHEKEIIKKYFSQLKEIIKKHELNPDDEAIKLLYGLNAHQFVKVRNLLKEFEKFERNSLNVMEEINNYIETLNYFLKDSSKKILFKEETSELTFNNLNKDGKDITQYKDINCLSSGEQQILILFSYIAFNSQNGKIFIIDEPELSLHIKWQEDFLEKLEKITPKNTQLILATHSPILANKKKEKALNLLSYNN